MAQETTATTERETITLSHTNNTTGTTRTLVLYKDLTYDEFASAQIAQAWFTRHYVAVHGVYKGDPEAKRAYNKAVKQYKRAVRARANRKFKTFSEDYDLKSITERTDKHTGENTGATLKAEPKEYAREVQKRSKALVIANTDCAKDDAGYKEEYAKAKIQIEKAYKAGKWHTESEKTEIANAEIMEGVK